MASQDLATRDRRSFMGYTECAMQTASQRNHMIANATGLLLKVVKRIHAADRKNRSQT